MSTLDDAPFREFVDTLKRCAEEYRNTAEKLRIAPEGGEPLPKGAGAKSWKELPLRKPREQKHYDSLDEMLGQLLDGEWKVHVSPLLGDRSTKLENFVGCRAFGRDYAFKIIAHSVVDPRVWLKLTFSAFDILQEARFECDSLQGGFVPQVNTCSADPLLDLCKVVIAGKLDRYTHPEAE